MGARPLRGARRRRVRPAHPRGGAALTAIEYGERLDGVEPAQLRGFFVGWPDPPSPERHLEILRGSSAVVLARLPDDGRVVGFVTAVSDGVLSAYIPLLEVLPEFHGRGIGTELMRRMLARLDGLYMVDLCCDAALEPFYRRLGLHVWDRGMGIRNFAAQSGRPASGAPDGAAASRPRPPREGGG